ncbi:uncharacterized protein N7473_003341 [Penicillium subrubescens]|uniref:uncharacterized protein n=1 Tax=Penicillium subrubescens TaxID=1316194 RepID=UPI002545A426|nr:uncharacterized protein N7473_003341 [Penicillium subrubescens]KAJ5906425.1 hypothetical protein N7473_003341 [Penicillium subrubescens]
MPCRLKGMGVNFRTVATFSACVRAVVAPGYSGSWGPERDFLSPGSSAIPGLSRSTGQQSRQSGPDEIGRGEEVITQFTESVGRDFVWLFRIFLRIQEEAKGERTTSVIT